MTKTAVGLFENEVTANKVVSELRGNDFLPEEIRVLGEPFGRPNPEALDVGTAEFEAGSIRELESIGATRLEVQAYLHGLRRGRVVVLATSSDGKVDGAARIMSQGGAFDVEKLMAGNRIFSAGYAKFDTLPRRV